jgi:hypothetical protein
MRLHGKEAQVSDEQINIAIAEACGWSEISDWKAAGINGLHPSGQWTEVIPNYTSDLNAMHEAMLLHPRKELLRDFLYLEVLEDPTNKTNEPAWATAKQWAMAYITSLGKWIE